MYINKKKATLVNFSQEDVTVGEEPFHVGYKCHVIGFPQGSRILEKHSFPIVFCQKPRGTIDFPSKWFLGRFPHENSQGNHFPTFLSLSLGFRPKGNWWIPVVIIIDFNFFFSKKIPTSTILKNNIKYLPKPTCKLPTCTII